jgi:predicted Zn-dependent protease
MNITSCLRSYLVLCSIPFLAQNRPPNDTLAEQAKSEFLAGNFPEAERDFRQITKQFPSNIVAQVYLGQALFRQEKYAESIGPFEKARDLEGSGIKLNLEQHRILTDQLAMAYGITGHLPQVHTLLDDAIRRDPEYPLNYYNLACTFAEEGNKKKMLTSFCRETQNITLNEAFGSFSHYFFLDKYVCLVAHIHS